MEFPLVSRFEGSNPAHAEIKESAGLGGLAGKATNRYNFTLLHFNLFASKYLINSQIAASHGKGKAGSWKH